MDHGETLRVSVCGLNLPRSSSTGRLRRASCSTALIPRRPRLAMPEQFPAAPIRVPSQRDHLPALRTHDRTIRIGRSRRWPVGHLYQKMMCAPDRVAHDGWWPHASSRGEQGDVSPANGPAMRRRSRGPSAMGRSGTNKMASHRDHATGITATGAETPAFAGLVAAFGSVVIDHPSHVGSQR